MALTRTEQAAIDHLSRLVAGLATTQHGIVTTDDLIELGMSSTTISRWVAIGRLHRVHPGIYAVGHAAPSRRGMLLAAVWSVGEHRAAIARRTALEVYGVWRPTERPIDLVVVGRVRPRDGVLLHHSRLLPDPHVRWVDHIRTTTPARTLMDLALELDAQELANVIHEMKYRRLYDRRSFIACIRRMHASVASRVALAALEMERIGSAGTRSELEQRVRALLVELGIADPISNVKVKTPIGWIELDNAWPDRKVYLEVDGPPHARQRSVNRDRDRYIGLRAAGWREVRIGYLELDLDRSGVSARLLRALS